MLILALNQFRAGNTATNPKLLPAGIGVSASNLDTMQGDFRGRRTASLAHTLTGLGSQQASIYRMGRDAPSDTAYWLSSSNDLDYARSMLASDPTERTYYTGESKPRYTDNTYLGSPPYPTGAVDLGIPAPSAAMSVALNVAGSGPNEDRVYLDTFLRANLDEGAPNVSSATITVTGGSTVNISGLAAVPGGAHGITKRRIYVSTGGDFRLVVEQNAALTTAADSGSRGAILQTGGATTKPAWLMPPDDLKGLIELWNGMHGAFAGKAFQICVPFNPHAWPVEYLRIVPDTIVGTATFGENWLLATTGLPRLVTGSAPAGMAARPINFKQACVSKRSVKGVGHGACWASNNGLAYTGQLGTFLLTERLLTRAQWQALVPSTIIGAAWGEWYVGFYNDGTRKAFMVNTVKPEGIIWLNQGAYGVFEDSISETLFILDAGNTIKKFDYGSVAAATFKSGVTRHPYATNPGAARVIATTYPVTFSLWADGDLKVSALSVTDDQGFRLPGGYEAEEFQAQIEGVGPAEALFVAEEMADLP